MTDSSVHVQPMSGEEVLARAEAFDPVQLVRDMAAAKGMTPQEWADAYNRLEPPKVPNRERIMRLALEMIVQQSGSDPWVLAALNQATAERALRECA